QEAAQSASTGGGAHDGASAPAGARADATQPALPELRLVQRFTRFVIRRGWALVGLLGWVVHWVVTITGSLLALALWSLAILLGGAAILDFVQWTHLTLHR